MRAASRRFSSRLIVAVACLSLGEAQADPIHSIADGAFWHHDSGWIFPGKIGEFALVGIPQDVAGSRDAVAHYACIVDGARITAAVDVYPADSAAAEAMMSEAPAKLSSEGPFAVGKTGALAGRRLIYGADGDDKEGRVALYFITSGEWRVRVRIAGARASLMPAMDAFVREQRWETLAGP